MRFCSCTVVARKLVTRATFLMVKRCINADPTVCHSVARVPAGKNKGLCYACCARKGRGNRVCGIRKSRCALKGLGQSTRSAKLPRSRCIPRRRVSLATEGFDSHRRQLLSFMVKGTAATEVNKYVNTLVHATLRSRAAHVQRVTLVEAPCGQDSEIAQANADLQGASLRIVKPVSGHPRQQRPPALVCGTVVEWELDVLTLKGRCTLGSYLAKVEPALGTEMVHFHASPVCTGSSRVTRCLNKKGLRYAVRRCHSKWRKGVGGMTRVIHNFRKGGYQRSGQRRSA